MKKSFLSFLGIILFCISLYSQEEIYDDAYKNNRRNETTEELPQDEEQVSVKKNRYNENYTEDSIKRKFDPRKLRIGGNFGLQIGTFTFINLSPTAGYLFLKDRLEVGAGPIFIYQSIRYSNNLRDRSFVYGSSVYSRGYIWKGIFAQAQYDFVNKESFIYLDKRVNVHHLLLGGGYAQPIGGAAQFFISVLYNVINSDESIYRGTFGRVPLIMNIGFGIGINRR